MSARVVYGLHCVWWDTIDKAAVKPSGLPCCPHCGSVLYQVDDEAAWFKNVDAHVEKTGDSEYRAFIEWLRGKCFVGMRFARERWYAEKVMKGV